MNRRHFAQSIAAAVGTSLVTSARPASPSPPPNKIAEPDRGAPLDPALVKEFVGAGHANIPRVKEMLATHARLINASYDWGGGDWETALGGASHIGHRPMALVLLEAGARIDAFAAAMLGETAVVTSLLRLAPATASTRGPHGYSLLYHAGYSGDIAMAQAIAAPLKERAHDFNQALQTSTLRGHTELVAWLLQNGVTNVNTKNFQGKTPLDVARERGHGEIVKALEAASAAK